MPTKLRQAKMTTKDLMPTGQMAREILAQRTTHISKQEKLQKTSTDTVDFIRFRLGNEYYGIPYLYIKEVIHHISLTKLPCTTSHIAGVINRRGKLLTILDLKHFFFNQSSDQHYAGYAIVVETEGMTAGILVDQIDGSYQYEPSLLNKAPPFQGAIKAEYLLGLYQNTTAIINVLKILSKLHSELGKAS